LNTIQITLKDNIKDANGEFIKDKINNYFNIETGDVKFTELFLLNYEFSNDVLNFIANNLIKDEIIHNIHINDYYKNDFYKSNIIVLKKHGVTDDSGLYLQKNIEDILNIKFENQQMFYCKFYYFENELTNEQLNLIASQLLGNEVIEKFIINFLPSRDLPWQVSALNNVVNPENNDVLLTIDLHSIDDSELINISKKRVLSLNLEEMKAIQSKFKTITDCELEIIAQTWSEHCKHKEFNAIIEYTNKNNKIETIDSLFKTYIKKSTELIIKRLKKYNKNYLAKVFNDNAGVVKISENKYFVFKVETHNSPSAIDPYGGAITGILGNNRDPFGTCNGGVDLLFNTNVLCFANPDYDKKLLKKQLHPRRVLNGVTKGIEDGGNKMGIPTINGAVVFDNNFAGKPLVFCGTGGIMTNNEIEKTINVGDLIVMTGGKAGKDGIHGATFSSAELNEDSPSSAVQIGSPIVQKMMFDFLLKAKEKLLINTITDNGAGGLSSSIGELATITNGAVVYLEKVPLKYKGLKPYEIFISESQERMTIAVSKENIEPFLALSKQFDVESTVIGEFNNSGNLTVLYDNITVADIDLDFLHNGVPKKHLIAKYKEICRDKALPCLHKRDKALPCLYNNYIKKLISQLNIASKEKIIRQYDSEVKGLSVLKPFMGTKNKTPQDCAVIRIDFNSYEGLIVSNGINPKYGYYNGYKMSQSAFDESVRKIISVGGKLPDIENDINNYWCVNDNFCVPNCVYDENNNKYGYEKLAKLVEMNKGLFDYSTFFNIPVISGKDSMKNDFYSEGKKISVPHTILYSTVCYIEDIRLCITSDFKNEGDLIYLIGKTFDELGESEFYNMQNVKDKNVPKVRKNIAKNTYKLMNSAQKQNLIKSSHHISDGGLIVSVIESCFGTQFGCLLNIKKDINISLFSESNSRFVISINKKDKVQFEQLLGKYCEFIGIVDNSKKITVNHKKKTIIDLQIDELYDLWSTRI